MKKLFEKITNKQRVEVDSVQYRSMFKKYFNNKNKDDFDFNSIKDDSFMKDDEEADNFNDFFIKDVKEEQMMIASKAIESKLEISEEFLDLIKSDNFMQKKTLTSHISIKSNRDALQRLSSIPCDINDKKTKAFNSENSGSKLKPQNNQGSQLNDKKPKLLDLFQ